MRGSLVRRETAPGAVDLVEGVGDVLPDLGPFDPLVGWLLAHGSIVVRTGWVAADAAASPARLSPMAERVLTEVCLRDVEDADLAWFYEHQADEAAAQLVGFKTRDPDAFAAHWAKSRADESVLLRTVLADGSVAGHVVSWEQGGDARGRVLAGP